MKVQLLCLLALVGCFSAVTHASTLVSPVQHVTDATDALGPFTNPPEAEPNSAAEVVKMKSATEATTNVDPKTATEATTNIDPQTATEATTEVDPKTATEAPPEVTKGTTVASETPVPPTNYTEQELSKITTPNIVEETMTVEPDEGIGYGQVVGIVIGALVAVIIVIAVVIVVVRRMGKYSP